LEKGERDAFFRVAGENLALGSNRPDLLGEKGLC